MIELGSGSSKKTAILIETFIKVFGKCNYYPIDISEEMLLGSAKTLVHKYKELAVTAVHGTYEDALVYVREELKGRPKMIVFLGSSFGNMSLNEGVAFLKKLRESKDSMVIRD